MEKLRRTLAVVIVSLLYTPAWAQEAPEEPAHPKGCAWWGVVGAAYAPLFGGAGHIEHEATLELAGACMLHLGHTELSIEPGVLVPFTMNGEKSLGVAPGLNLTWYLLSIGRWHVGPRIGAYLRANLPIGHDGAIGPMWHAGLEAEVEVVHEKFTIFGAVQYAGVKLWSLGEHVEAEPTLYGPELLLGAAFHL